MMPKSWFILICFAFIFVNSSFAETLGQKILQKYQEQADSLACGSIGSVEFREYEPDANVPNISVFKLRLACRNLRNLDIPCNVREIALADCNYLVASGGNECGDYIMFYMFDNLLRDYINEESEDFKTDILGILENVNFSKSEALKTYNTARQELINTNDRDLWMRVFTFDKKKLTQLEDPVLITKYAMILRSNPATMVDWMDTEGGEKTTFPHNIMIFENKCGTVQFWPTTDDTFKRFCYSFQQYDKKGNLIFWGRLKIKKEAAGKDRGQSFLWQLHRNTELLD